MTEPESRSDLRQNILKHILMLCRGSVKGFPPLPSIMELHDYDRSKFKSWSTSCSTACISNHDIHQFARHYNDLARSFPRQKPDYHLAHQSCALCLHIADLCWDLYPVPYFSIFLHHQGNLFFGGGPF